MSVRPLLRAIDQSDCRIAGCLFFIDTAFQVSIGVLQVSIEKSRTKSVILKLVFQAFRRKTKRFGEDRFFERVRGRKPKCGYTVH